MVKIKDSLFVIFTPQQVIDLDILRAKYNYCRRDLRLDSLKLVFYKNLSIKNEKVVESKNSILTIKEKENDILIRRVNKLERRLWIEKKKKYFVGGSFLFIFGVLKYLKVF